jgi:hypothetical protein
LSIPNTTPTGDTTRSGLAPAAIIRRVSSLGDARELSYPAGNPARARRTAAGSFAMTASKMRAVLRSVACACINFLRAKLKGSFKQTDRGYSSSQILSFQQSGDVTPRIGDWPQVILMRHPNSRLVDRGDLPTRYRRTSAGYDLSALAPAQRAVAQRLSALARFGQSRQCSNTSAVRVKAESGERGCEMTRLTPSLTLH